MSLLFILIIFESGPGCLLNNLNMNQYVIIRGIIISVNSHENMKYNI